MSKKKMSSGEDGAKDNHGDFLPELSKRASILEYEKLLNVESPDYSKKAPGSIFWTKLAYFLTDQSMNLQFKNFMISGKEKMNKNNGILTVCWHTNGLMDVTPIINHHPNYLVVGGRHDLVNHPILGFWARRMAVQPVVRQAELMRGGCTEEEAKFLNGRSLIRLSKGIASGFGGILMPEGTSHHESHLIRLKTGPARVLTSAATIANYRGAPKPQIIPVGMHFRKRHLLRTDLWIEFCEPINYDLSEELLGLGSKYEDEEWIEPPAKDVYHVRDLLKLNLDKITPGATTWDSYRGWRLLTHLKARIQSKNSLNWKEEVEGAREWRELSDKTLGTHEEQNESGPKDSEYFDFFSEAESAAKILDNHNLDGREINSKGELRNFSPINVIKSIPGVLLTFLLFPLLFLSSGIFLLVCNYLGNVTDEGEDARTSIHFVGFITAPLILWPISATIFVFLLAYFFDIRPAIMGLEQITLIDSVPFYLTLWLFTFPLFWIINYLFFTFCLDSFNDFSKEFRIRKLHKLTSGSHLKELLRTLDLKLIEFLKQSGHN